MKAKKLSKQELRILENHFSSVYFPNSFDLVYEDQVPIIAIVLLEGEAHFTKKKKVSDSIGPGTILGIQEMLNNETVKHGCKILENAKVILLQKSEIAELVKGPDSKLKQLITTRPY